VAVLPAVLALAEERGSSGAALIEAFVAGYETACRVGRLIAPGHYDGLGFHATGTVGTFGAAAGCAHLLGLDEEATLHAMGIAATQAAGLKSMFGNMYKPLHAGRAAQAGLLAARLAARGFTAQLDSYSDALVQDPVLASLHARTTVEFQAGWPSTRAVMDIRLMDQTSCSAAHDSGIPATDVADQEMRLEAKFARLAAPVAASGRRRTRPAGQHPGIADRRWITPTAT
jgi:2-methylcitrate dehydratase PrpD